MPAHFRRVAFAISLTVGGLCLAGTPVMTASAHDFPVSSTPPENGVLTELPATFDLTMNEDMLDLGSAGNGFALQIVGPDGLYYGDGCVNVVGATMSTPAALGAPGAYTMRWQIVSADGHAVSDEYPFTWAPTTPGTSSAGSAAPPVCGATPSAEQNEDQPTPPEPSASTAATDAPSSTAPDAASSDLSSSAPLFIGGAVLALAAIVATALILIERRRGSPPQ